MPFDPERHHRRSIRLRGYDYTQPGSYFVTICVEDRARVFGDVFDAEMALTRLGRTVEEAWRGLPRRFRGLAIDAFVVMPNHVHGLLWLEHDDTLSQPALGDALGWFKTVTTNLYIHGVRDAGWPSYDRRLWQRTFHEHIVRNESDMERIRSYIVNNPANWHEDRYHGP